MKIERYEASSKIKNYTIEYCQIYKTHNINMVKPKLKWQYKYCSHCDYITKNASTMSMHMSMKHIMKPKHECSECFEKFPTKTQLEHHYVNHHCEANISCKHLGCTKVFKNTTSQKIHYTRKHMKNIQLFVPTETKGYVRCITCNYEATKSAIYYHVANCSPYSPFSEKFINYSGNTCLPCEDVPVLENLASIETTLNENFISALPPMVERNIPPKEEVEVDSEEEFIRLLNDLPSYDDEDDEDIFVSSYSARIHVPRE